MVAVGVAVRVEVEVEVEVEVGVEVEVVVEAEAEGEVHLWSVRSQVGCVLAARSNRTVFFSMVGAMDEVVDEAAADPGP